MPDTISSPKPRHPLRPEQSLHPVDAQALDISGTLSSLNSTINNNTNNSINNNSNLALPAPATAPSVKTAMTPLTTTKSIATNAPSSPPPVVLGKRAAHDMLPADGDADAGADGAARLAKRPANDAERADSATADGTAPGELSASAALEGPLPAALLALLTAAPNRLGADAHVEDEGGRPQTNGNVVHTLPGALDVLISATESCRVRLARVKAERVAVDESAALVERLENGLRGLQEQGIAVVERYVRSIQAEVDMFRPRQLQNGVGAGGSATHGGLNRAGDAAKTPPVAAPSNSSQASSDMANDAAMAHRMWAYLEKCTLDLDDGRRAWLIKYNAIKKQQEAYDKHVKSLHEREEHLRRMEEWLPRAEQVVVEGEGECKRRLEEVHLQRAQITEGHREVERLKTNLLSWARDEGHAYQRRFGNEGGGPGGGVNGGPAHWVAHHGPGSGPGAGLLGGSKPKPIKGDMYFVDQPPVAPFPQPSQAKLYQSQQQQQQDPHNPVGKGLLAARLPGSGPTGPPGPPKKTTTNEASTSKQTSGAAGKKSGGSGAKTKLDIMLGSAASPPYELGSLGDAEAEVSRGDSLSFSPGGSPSSADGSAVVDAVVLPFSGHSAFIVNTLASGAAIASRISSLVPALDGILGAGTDLACVVRPFAQDLPPGSAVEYRLLADHETVAASDHDAAWSDAGSSLGSCRLLRIGFDGGLPAGRALVFGLSRERLAKADDAGSGGLETLMPAVYQPESEQPRSKFYLHDNPPNHDCPDDLYCSDLSLPLPLQPQVVQAHALSAKVAGPSGESSSLAPKPPPKALKSALKPASKSPSSNASAAAGGMAALTAAVATAAAAEELAAESGAGAVDETKPLPGNDGGGGDDGGVKKGDDVVAKLIEAGAETGWKGKSVAEKDKGKAAEQSVVTE